MQTSNARIYSRTATRSLGERRVALCKSNATEVSVARAFVQLYRLPYMLVHSEQSVDMGQEYSETVGWSELAVADVQDAPMILRPVRTTPLPSHAMASTGPETMYSTSGPKKGLRAAGRVTVCRTSYLPTFYTRRSDLISPHLAHCTSLSLIHI